MHISEDRAEEIMEDGQPVDQGTWRWGHTETYVFEENGKHYAFLARFQPEHGCQNIDGGIDCYEVEAVEVKTIKWRQVKTAVAPGAAPAQSNV